MGRAFDFNRKDYFLRNQWGGGSNPPTSSKKSLTILPDFFISKRYSLNFKALDLLKITVKSKHCALWGVWWYLLLGVICGIIFVFRGEDYAN